MKRQIRNLKKLSIKILSDRRLWLSFLVVLVFFGIFAQVNFATDTYADYGKGEWETMIWFLKLGRFITAGLTGLIGFLGIKIEIVSFCSFCLAVLALGAAIYLLDKLIGRFVKNSILSYLMAAAILINPFVIELFFFVEKGVMMLGVLSCVIALWYFIQFLGTKNKKKLIAVTAFCFLATGCYQGALGVFIVLAVLFTLLNANKWKDFIVNTLIGVAIYGGTLALNLVLTQLTVGSGRSSGSINLVGSIQKVLDSSEAFFGFFGIVPAALMAFALIATLLATIIYAITHHFSKSQNLKAWLGLPYILIVLLLAALAPVLAQDTSLVWLVPRSTYIFASAVGIVVLLLGAVSNSFGNNKTYIGIICALLLAVLGTEFYNFTRIETEQFATKALDMERALRIEEEIAKYEQKTGITIHKISVSNDSAVRYSYDHVTPIRDSNITAFSTSWSDVNSINYWTGKNYERVEAVPEETNYCAQHDWSYFDSEQLLFDDDKLHICAY